MDNYFYWFIAASFLAIILLSLRSISFESERRKPEIFDKEIYRQFSVKSRVAYSLVCLDNLYDHFNVSKETDEYKYLTNIFWIFIEHEGYKFNFISLSLEFGYSGIITNPLVEMESGEWREFISPEQEKEEIKQAKSFIEGYEYDIPFLENKQDRLERYYASLPDPICDVYHELEELWEWGWDAKDNEDDENTLSCMDSIVKKLRGLQIELPPTEPFLFSAFSEHYGIGNPVPKRRIEAALGRKL